VIKESLFQFKEAFTMSFFELMLNTGPALNIIFMYGVQPKDEDFFELTEEQYKKCAEDGMDSSEKLYTWLAPKISYDSNEILVMSEDEKEDLFAADRLIEKYCEKSDKSFKDYDEKLKYVAKLLPNVFTDKTKYESKVVSLS
jgi:hypothetical protein